MPTKSAASPIENSSFKMFPLFIYSVIVKRMDLEIFGEIKSAAPLQNTVVLKCMFCFSL